MKRGCRRRGAGVRCQVSGVGGFWPRADSRQPLLTPDTRHLTPMHTLELFSADSRQPTADSPTIWPLRQRLATSAKLRFRTAQIRSALNAQQFRPDRIRMFQNSPRSKNANRGFPEGITRFEVRPPPNFGILAQHRHKIPPRLRPFRFSDKETYRALSRPSLGRDTGDAQRNGPENA